MKPRTRKPMKRSELRRSSWMPRGTTLIVRKMPIAKRNDARRSKVAKRRAKERRSKAEMDARAEAWIRAAGVCECGCGVAFDPDASVTDPGHPEWHHPTTKSYTTHEGLWLRRECHHRVELRDFPHRHGPRRTY